MQQVPDDDRADSFGSFSSQFATWDTLFTAEEWDAFLEDARCIDSTPNSSVYLAHANLAKVEGAEIVVKVLSAQYSEENAVRFISAARERRRRACSLGVSGYDGLVSHSDEAPRMHVRLHTFESVAIDTRGRLVGQCMPLPIGSVSLLDMVAFCRPTSLGSRSGERRSRVLTTEAAALLRLVSHGIKATLEFNKDPTRQFPFVHGNLTSGNIFFASLAASHETDENLQLIFTDPADGLTFPMLSLDASAFSTNHLKYIEEHIVAPAVAHVGKNNVSLLHEEMHLRYEEAPYRPRHSDDVCAIGALAYFMFLGHQYRHGFSVAEAALLDNEPNRESTAFHGDASVALLLPIPDRLKGHPICCENSFLSLRASLSALLSSSSRNLKELQMALDFISRTLLMDNSINSHRSVGIFTIEEALAHPLLASTHVMQPSHDAAIVRRLMVEAQSNMETFFMFAGSGPLRVRPFRNVFLNNSASLIHDMSVRLTPRRVWASELSSLQRLGLLFPGVFQSLELIEQGLPVPSVDETLSHLLPHASIALHMATGSLVIDGAEDVDWSVSDEKMQMIAVTAVLQDYLVRLGNAVVSSGWGDEARALAHELELLSARLFPETQSFRDESSTILEEALRLSSSSPFSTFVTHLVIKNCERCSFGLFVPMETVTIESVASCRLFLGPSKRAIIRNVEGCEPIALAAELLFIEGNVFDCVLSLHLADNPRCSSLDMESLLAHLGDSSIRVSSGEQRLRDVQFIPYVVSYRGLNSHFENLNLLKEHKATLLNFEEMDVGKERKMFDLSLSAIYDRSCSRFGSPLSFIDYYDRRQQSRFFLSKVCNLNPALSFRSWASQFSIGDAPVRFRDYSLPSKSVLQPSSLRLPSGPPALCDYPFLPKIAHGMVYRHYGGSCGTSMDLFLGYGEVSNWSVEICDVHGDCVSEDSVCRFETGNIPSLVSDKSKRHFLSSLRCTMLGSALATQSDMEPEEHAGRTRHNNSSPILIILDAIDEVTITNVSYCTIVIAASAASIVCTNVHRCKMFLISKGEIVFNGCSRLDVSGYSQTEARVDLHLKGLSFGVGHEGLGASSQVNCSPLVLRAPHLDSILQNCEMFVGVDDFSSLLPPNCFCPQLNQLDQAKLIVLRNLGFFTLDVPHDDSPSDVMVDASRVYSPQDLSHSVPLSIQPLAGLGSATTLTPFTTCIHSLVDCSILRMPGALAPLRKAAELSLTIAHIDCGVIHIAESLDVLYVAHCTGPLDIVVAAAQTVIVDDCQGVTVQVACFDFLVTNSHSCHFALHVNSQPKVDDGFSYWNGVLSLQRECDRYSGNGCDSPNYMAHIDLKRGGSRTIADPHPCTEIRFSALNVTCLGFESFLESSFVQIAPNLYDQPILVRLPPPEEVQIFFTECEKFLEFVRVPLPTFASPKRASGTCVWPIMRTDLIVESNENVLAHAHDLEDSPAIAPLGYAAHVFGLNARCLRELSFIFKDSMSSVQQHVLSSLLNRIFPPSGWAVSGGCNGIQEPRTNRQNFEKVPSFDAGLLIVAPLQGTVIGGDEQSLFVSAFADRVDEDTHSRFEPLLRVVASVRWRVECQILNSFSFVPFKAISEEIQNIVLDGVERDPFDEIKRLSMLLTSVVLARAEKEALPVGAALSRWLHPARRTVKQRGINATKAFGVLFDGERVDWEKLAREVGAETASAIQKLHLRNSIRSNVYEVERSTAIHRFEKFRK